jgi:chemotaxis protein methyltransferase CheR
MESEIREFVFTSSDFDRVCRLLYGWAGIKLSDTKRDMVYSRLARQVRAHGLPSFKAYIDLAERSDGKHRQEFINALTTNLTSFFREGHHFERFKTWLGEKKHSKVEVWCAAASTGEEPYSIVMSACEHYDSLRPPFHLIASDVDTNVLATGQQGVYALERIEKMDEARLKRFFLRGKEGNNGLVKVRPELQQLIDFQQINLLDANWAAFKDKKFDAIFCRNVMIYFDRPTQEKLVRRFRELLQPDGLLFVGHSESLHFATDYFKSMGNTIYKPI